MKLVLSVQEELKKFYTLNSFPNVSDYFISEKQLQTQGVSIQENHSQVLCLEENNEVLVGIYFRNELFEKLKTNSTDLTIQELCECVEEISHFHYILWSLFQGRSITCLQIEVQGEIDKFLILRNFFQTENECIQYLFENIYFRKNINTEEQYRYQKAHQWGYKYVRKLLHLKSNHIHQRLNQFYRKNQYSRIQEILCAA